MLYCISPSTWGNQREVRDLSSLQHQAISGAGGGDSSLQDRGVAHYLLSLLFSLVSLPFSFNFCVPYQKHQKNTCYLSCVVRYVRSWYYEVIRGIEFASKEWGEYEEGMG